MFCRHGTFPVVFAVRYAFDPFACSTNKFSHQLAPREEKGEEQDDHEQETSNETREVERVEHGEEEHDGQGEQEKTSRESNEEKAVGQREEDEEPRKITNRLMEEDTGSLQEKDHEEQGKEEEEKNGMYNLSIEKGANQQEGGTTTDGNGEGFDSG